MFRTSLWSSEVRCEVQKFISEFTSQFVNKGCDWLLNSMKPIKCLVYKPACEFWNELLNFATNFRTSQQSSESYNEKLPEIDCNYNHHLRVRFVELWFWISHSRSIFTLIIYLSICDIVVDLFVVNIFLLSRCEILDLLKFLETFKKNCLICNNRSTPTKV